MRREEEGETGWYVKFKKATDISTKQGELEVWYLKLKGHFYVHNPLSCQYKVLSTYLLH